MQDLRISGDTDYESVLTTNCLSSFPTALFRLTKLTSLSLSSRGLCYFYSVCGMLLCLGFIGILGSTETNIHHRCSLKPALCRSLRSVSLSVQV